MPGVPGWSPGGAGEGGGWRGVPTNGDLAGRSRGPSVKILLSIPVQDNARSPGQSQQTLLVLSPSDGLGRAMTASLQRADYSPGGLHSPGFITPHARTSVVTTLLSCAPREEECSRKDGAG